MAFGLATDDDDGQALTQKQGNKVTKKKIITEDELIDKLEGFKNWLILKNVSTDVIDTALLMNNVKGIEEINSLELLSKIFNQIKKDIKGE